MAKRPGVFDPWRQEAPVPRDVVPAQPYDPDRKPSPPTCIVFDGLRSALNVWVPVQDSDEVENLLARRILIEAVHHLSKQEMARKVFLTWGVKADADPGVHNVVLTDDDHRSITMKGDTEDRMVKRAIDVLALSLRDCGPQAQLYLRDLGVIPLLK